MGDQPAPSLKAFEARGHAGHLTQSSKRAHREGRRGVAQLLESLVDLVAIIRVYLKVQATGKERGDNFHFHPAELRLLQSHTLFLS